MSETAKSVPEPLPSPRVEPLEPPEPAPNTVQTTDAHGENASEPALPPAYAGWPDDPSKTPADPITQDIDAGASLLQEVVDFLHRLFPGHGAPGTPSAPPE